MIDWLLKNSNIQENGKKKIRHEPNKEIENQINEGLLSEKNSEIAQILDILTAFILDHLKFVADPIQEEHLL